MPLFSPPKKPANQSKRVPRDQTGESSEFVNTSPPLQHSMASFAPEYPSPLFPQVRPRQDSEQTVVPDVETGPTNSKGETIPFECPKDVFATLISSTRAKVVFVSPASAVAYTLYSPYSRRTIKPPQNCKWQKGGFAGDFLALRSVFSTHDLQVRPNVATSEPVHY